MPAVEFSKFKETCDIKLEDDESCAVCLVEFENENLVNYPFLLSNFCEFLCFFR